MTSLLPFNDAFASVKVASYQPLIVRWYSRLGLAQLQESVSTRGAAPLSPDELSKAGGTAAPTWARYSPTTFGWGLLASELAGAGLRFFKGGPLTDTMPGPDILFQPATGGGGTGDSNVQAACERMIARPDRAAILLDEAKIPNYLLLDLGPLLSPIGVMHLYRQLYYDLSSGVGPIEQVFSIAPNEEVEVVQETVRRQSFERTEEFGHETSFESQESVRNLEEISDEVSNAIRYETTVAVSGEAGGSYGVYSFGGSASTDLGVSVESAGKYMSRNSRETNRTSAERIRKSYKLQVRTVSEMTERSNVRRLIRNATDTPVNYALRRVLRKVRVKVQYLGPRLCWQVYVSNPGEGLARDSFIAFQTPQQALTPELPPGSPPKPTGRETTGTQDVNIRRRDIAGHGEILTIELVFPPDQYLDLSAVRIDRLTDADRRQTAPNPLATNTEYEATAITPDVYQVEQQQGGSLRVRLSIAGPEDHGVSVQYTAFWSPSAAAIDAWQQQVDALVADLEAVAVREFNERQQEVWKRRIDAMSRVRPRPAADLRKEERYEVLSRLIGYLYASTGSGQPPAPLEVESFHSLFDERALFYYPHPSWWWPRYRVPPNGIARPSYAITEESEPAPLGSSLAWAIQADGDRRRNEFLNSPWVRACVPIRAGRERDAVEWLARRLEGEHGYDDSPDMPLGTLIADIEERRKREELVDTGPDYVTLGGEVAPTEQDDAGAYPVVSQFEVVLPTEGFAYDKVTIAG